MDNIYQTSTDIGKFSADYEDVLSELKQLEKEIRKFKRKKGGAKSKKKRKLKKRVKALELEYEQLRQFSFFLACQYKEQPDRWPWWQNMICETLPKAFEFATATVNRLPAKTQPLCLTDDSDRK